MWVAPTLRFFALGRLGPTMSSSFSGGGGMGPAAGSSAASAADMVMFSDYQQGARDVIRTVLQAGWPSSPVLVI